MFLCLCETVLWSRGIFIWAKQRNKYVENVLTRGLVLLQSIQHLSPVTSTALLHSADFSQPNIKIHLHPNNCSLITEYCSRPNAWALWLHSDNAQWLLATESVFNSRAIISHTRKSLSCLIISAKSLWYSSPWYAAR